MHDQAAIIVQNCLHTAFISIYFYDSILLFPLEVERIWKRLGAQGSWWYILNRYLTAIGFVLVIIFDFIELSPEGCNRYSLIRQGFIVLNVLIIGIVFTLRTYALYERSKLILAVILVPSTALFSTACWSLGTQDTSEPFIPTMTMTGCHVSSTYLQGAHIAVAWECLVGFDTILFLLTAARAIYLTPSTRSRSPSIHCFSILHSTSYLNLIGIIYRDGAVYFGVMALFNLANVITFYTAPDLLRGALSTPSSAVSALLCARLMLNIHEAPVPTGALALPSHSTGAEATGPNGRAAFTSQFELGAENVDTLDVYQVRDSPLSIDKSAWVAEYMNSPQSAGSRGSSNSYHRTRSGTKPPQTREEWEMGHLPA